MRKNFLRTIIAIVPTTLILTAVVAVGATSPSPIVTTPNGPLRGILRNGVREFLGVPYAAPPVGSLRWRAPRPHAVWRTTLDATHTGPSCPQLLPGGDKLWGAENCLLLNIYMPNPPLHDLPVMFWIHGGAFILGSAANFDGSALAKKHKLVVVTVNYRLGALGFLAHPSLDAENRPHVSGNYGLLDQQAALQWVKRNIRWFGGDPQQVTIAGESAGGFSVCAQLTSPAALGLFRAAIIESGPCTLTITKAQAARRGSELVTRLGCDKAADTAACLRAKSAAQVVSVMPGNLAGPLLWAPVVDGKVMPKQPLQAFHDGTFNKVPVINGSNRDEGTLFVALGRPISAENFGPAIDSFAQAVSRGGASDHNAAKVEAEYPLRGYQSPAQGFAAVLGDAVFSCPIERVGELLAGFVPTYEYEFNDRDAPATLIMHPPFPLGHITPRSFSTFFRLPFPLMRDEWRRSSRPRSRNCPMTWPAIGRLSWQAARQTVPHRPGCPRSRATSESCPFRPAGLVTSQSTPPSITARFGDRCATNDS
jgi:para-nitrobenzyl esterase